MGRNRFAFTEDEKAITVQGLLKKFEGVHLQRMIEIDEYIATENQLEFV